MSRTIKEGKGSKRKPKVRSKSVGVADAVRKRQTFGSTEKILRRNRKTWTRLANKRRRAEDQTEIEKSTDLVECLRPLTDEELANFKPATKEEIQSALDEGRRQLGKAGLHPTWSKLSGPRF
jgi:hypothetical protein